MNSVLWLILALYLGGAVAVNWRYIEDRAELLIQCAPFPPGDPCSADLDRDGVVSVSDFVLLSGHFGAACDMTEASVQ